MLSYGCTCVLDVNFFLLMNICADYFDLFDAAFFYLDESLFVDCHTNKADIFHAVFFLSCSVIMDCCAGVFEIGRHCF